jgi:hypothetical protein
MHTTMTDPDTPNLGIWIAGQQALGSCERILSHFKRTRVNIDGHNFPSITRFNVCPDVALIDVISAPRMFFLAIARLPHVHGLPLWFVRCSEEVFLLLYTIYSVLPEDILTSQGKV